MVENKNIYKGLECYCNHFEKIPIDRRDLGIAGDIAPYAFAIGEGYTIYKFNQYAKQENIGQWGQKSARINIKMNGGLLSFLQAIIEGKSGERGLKEAGISVASGIFADKIIDNKLGNKIIENATKHTLNQTSKLASSSATRLATSRVASNIAAKTGVSLLTRIATGAAVGSTAPIVGTIIGAVAGALIAGMVNDYMFADEDEQLKKDKAHNAEIERLEKEYKLKIDRITDYLVRYHYIELRELTEAESEELCKEVGNLKNSYFQTIMLMQSFPNYLDIDKEFYETLQEKALDSKEESKEINSTESKQLQIKPIADSISLTIELEKCHNGISLAS